MNTPTGKNSTCCQYAVNVRGYNTTNAAVAMITAVFTGARWRTHQRLTGPMIENLRTRAAQRFAEQARRPEHQHQHEDDEGDHVLPLTSQHRRAPLLQQAERQASH